MSEQQDSGKFKEALIALDDEATWPREVIHLLDACVGRLPEAQADVAGAIDALIRDREIVGYHCTRLARDEIERVKKEGLSPLTPELRQSRVEQRIRAGDLSREIADHLLSLGITGDGRHRLGYSCFYFTREIGNWCWKFFRYWGGESIYVPRMSIDSEERLTLRSIGIPCIIEIAVPVNMISYHSVAQGLLYEYARRRGVKTQESSHDVAKHPMRVLRVIEYGSPDFDSWTRDISWPSPIEDRKIVQWRDYMDSLAAMNALSA